MTKNKLEQLFARPVRPNPSVFSIYLNVDQSRQANLNRGFEIQLNNLILSIRNTLHNSTEIEKFDDATRRIKDFVSHYLPRGRGLVMFFDTVDGFFWQESLDVPLPNEARWNGNLFSQPLADALDQFERYAVVLVDRANLRLFSVFMGRIEESVRKEFGPGRTRHIKTAGTDNLGSASRIQRKADEQIRTNLRGVAAVVDSFVQTHQVHRLILAGTTETTAELLDLLPKRLSSRVIGIISLSIEATEQETLAAAQTISDEYERSTELEIVNEVLTTAAKTTKAVLGLNPTLKAVNSNRVWQFVYSQGLSSPGFECTKCSALYSVNRAHCLSCNGSLHRIADVVERAVEQASSKGAKIEVVTGEAAEALKSSGGVAAFLKTRTASRAS
jgi:peptide chain release factor subunit 1